MSAASPINHNGNPWVFRAPPGKILEIESCGINTDQNVMWFATNEAEGSIANFLLNPGGIYTATRKP